MRAAVLLALALSSACAPATDGGETEIPTPVTLPVPSADSVIRASSGFSDSVAWTAAPRTVIATGSAGQEIELDLFTRLEVRGRDSLGVRVVCAVCVPSVEGQVLADNLVAEAIPPEVAAWGTLPEFLLAVRAAAARRDLALLRPVMATDFTYAFVGIQAPDQAFAFWRAENFRSLDELPDLLDRGVRTTDGRIWAAPPAFVSDLGYRGPRAGFRRRADGRWEWVHLIRDISERR